MKRWQTWILAIAAWVVGLYVLRGLDRFLLEDSVHPRWVSVAVLNLALVAWGIQFTFWRESEPLREKRYFLIMALSWTDLLIRGIQAWLFPGTSESYEKMYVATIALILSAGISFLVLSVTVWSYVGMLSDQKTEALEALDAAEGLLVRGANRYWHPRRTSSVVASITVIQSKAQLTELMESLRQEAEQYENLRRGKADKDPGEDS